MDQMDIRHIAQLEARIYRMELMMQALVVHLGINPADIVPQEPPEVIAVREAIGIALQKGDKIKAIKIFREFYGVSLEEARTAINGM